MDEALRSAKAQEVFVATISDEILENGLIVCRVYDRVTSDRGTVRSTVVGVEVETNANAMRVLTDSQLLAKMNILTEKLGASRYDESAAAADADSIGSFVERAKSCVSDGIQSLDLPYQVPEVETLGVLWPHAPRQDGAANP